VTDLAGPLAELPDPLIELSGVSAGYGGIIVLRDIDLTVSPGQLLVLLGPNGAGKSTLLKVLSGQLAPTAGHVHVGGFHVNDARAAELARIGLCLIPEGRGVFPNLTVRDNLRVFTHAGLSLEEIEERSYARFPRLKDRRSQQAGTLSGGEQQMLALSRGLATDPAILLLDELSMGLAPVIVRELFEMVTQVAASGVTVIVVEQFAKLAVPIADRVGIMSGGHLVWEGAPADVDAALAGAYLGAQPLDAIIDPVPSRSTSTAKARRRKPLKAASSG
jgi:branched-chain amino acid transport system ATP-binding protein